MSKPTDEGTPDLQRQLAGTFRRTAEVLDQSARLAEDDAERRARQDDADLHAIERDRAKRARAGARQARINAERLGS
jgi:hypothetical protein